MPERYVLVKSLYGMGGRIHVLLGAWDYARRTNRTLVVDWSDFFYGGGADTFQSFFKNPFLKFSRFREIVGAANKPESTPPPPRIYPAIWQANFADIGIGESLDNLYDLCHCPPPEHDVPEDIVVVTWPNGLLAVDERAKLACQLRPSDRIQTRVEELCGQFDIDAAIGIHYRHGGGEPIVFAPQPEWFEQAVTKLDPTNSRPLFFCTDSKFAEQHFRQTFGPRFHSSDKLFPESGCLHGNPAIEDKVKNGEDALVDLYTLARCRDFIHSGHFYGKTARFLGAGAGGKYMRYPGMARMKVATVIDAIGRPVQQVANNAELAAALKAAGIRLDHLWFDRDGPQLRLYYGADLLLELAAEQLEKSMPRLIEQLQRRRLYV